MGFITSPSPSNTTSGRAGGRQKGREGKEQTGSYYNSSVQVMAAISVQVLLTGLPFSMATENRNELEIDFII